MGCRMLLAGDFYKSKEKPQEQQTTLCDKAKKKKKKAEYKGGLKVTC